MKLFIELSAREEANLRAFVGYMRAHPEYIGVASGNWNNGAPDFQTRIVLEEQTRERFEEIAAQLEGGAPSGLTPQVLADWTQTLVDATGVIVAAEREGNVTSRRRVHCKAGQTYSVKFAVQSPGAHGYIDASPMVRATIAIVPAGRGSAGLSITDAPAVAELLGGFDGAAGDTYANENFAQMIGKTKYANFIVGQDTDVFLDFTLPTPRN